MNAAPVGRRTSAPEVQMHGEQMAPKTDSADEVAEQYKRRDTQK